MFSPLDCNIATAAAADFYNDMKLQLKNSSWHIIEDETETVDEHALDKNILSCAIIVQSSRYGKLWQTGAALTDVFTAESILKAPIFKANDIQLQNGCHDRIIVAY